MVNPRISASDEARYTALNDAFLPTQATVVRTGLTVNCRITIDTRRLPITGLPDYYRIPRFRTAFTVDEDVTVGDHLIVASKRYCLTEEETNGTYGYGTVALAMLFAVSATGSITRNPTSLAHGGTFTTVIPSTTFRNVEPQLFVPVNADFISDTFGVDIEQPAWTLMDYPAGNTQRFPVQPGDYVAVGAQNYPVRMVLPTSAFLVLYISTGRSS